MTPEERARKTIEEMGFNTDLISRCHEETLSVAIRTAENDALERAAVFMHPALRSMISRGEAADTIRALKHKS